MSEVTAVPLRPIKKGSLVTLWLGVVLIAAVGAAVAYKGTSRQVAMAEPASDFLTRNAKKSGVVTTPSGLQYQVIEEGKGPKPQPTDMVVVEYEGKLANGETFDASANHGGPATLPVGGLIPGWVEGLQLMSPGAKYRFWVPPQLGYGETGAGGVIPPDALLIFDVRLLAVAPQQPGMGGIGMPPQGEIGGM
jgi:FKBP-type peptidyl-prolyl cis-trans isomerase FkpA